MGRRKTRPLGRRGGSAPGSRSPKEVVHFCVEGLTEERYLRALLDHRYPEIFVPRFLGRRGKGRAWKTSLVNLVRAAKQGERSWQRSERGQVIWIVADAAANEVHQAELQRWLDDAGYHRSALQAVSLEGWFLQHLDEPSRPQTDKEALRCVTEQWPGYAKGREIPGWLIDSTDIACARERAFLGNTENAGVWPLPRSSQLPALVAYLDQRSQRLRGG